MNQDFSFSSEGARLTNLSYQRPDVLNQRRYTLKYLDLQPGEQVLDVGSGPGLLAEEMAEQVEELGHVYGIEPSQPMLSLATDKCQHLPQVSFLRSYAHSLPFCDQSMDAVISTQVLEYVPEVDLALQEMHRILKPGGRVLILDSDWDSVVWNTESPERMQKVLSAWDSRRFDPYLPRKLPAKLRSAGFHIQKIEVYPILNTAYGEEYYSHALMNSVYRHACSELGEEVAEEWRRDLLSKAEQDDWFFSLNRYLFLATRPE